MRWYFEIIWIACYPTASHSLVLVSIDDLHESVTTLWIAKWRYLNSIISSICLSWHSFVYCIYSITVESLISFCYNPLLSLVIVVLKLAQIWPVGVPSSQCLCPFDVFPLFLEHFLVFCTTGCSRLSFYLPCPMPGISHFSKESGGLHGGAQQSVVHRMSKPSGSSNGVYVVSVLGCDLGIFLGCKASQALFSGPTGDVMSRLIPFNHSLCI